MSSGIKELQASIQKISVQIDTAIEIAEQTARVLAIDVFDLKDEEGHYIMNQLIDARIRLREAQRKIEAVNGH